MTVARVDKVTIADEMLEAAIAEFFEGRHFAALNLAAVAQEIYGKQARLEGLTDQVQGTIEAANEFGKRRGRPKVADRAWKRIAGQLKNSIKHMDSGNDRHIEIDAPDEARLMIHDAVCEHDKVKRPNTAAIDRFSDYARDYSRKQSAQ